MAIDEGDFLRELEFRVSNDGGKLSYIAEMGNYGHGKTGLPIWIYVDSSEKHRILRKSSNVFHSFPASTCHYFLGGTTCHGHP